MDSTSLQYAEVDGARLCFRDSGEGRPLLFLHGTSASLGVWDGVIGHLDGGYRAVALDQRGHGRSSKPAHGYSQQDFARDILGLVSSLGLKDVVLVGHSLGARNAVVAADAAPELFAGVVAVDYLPFVEPQVIDDLENRVLGGFRSFGTEAEIVDYLCARYPRTPRAALQRRAAYGYQRQEDRFLPLADPEAMRGTVDSFRTDFAEAFRSVRVPVAVLRGEHSAIVSPRAYARSQQERPDFSYITVPDCDHYIPEVAPEAIARAITTRFPAIDMKGQASCPSTSRI
ncbi:alpha/beta hydrolase [Arthrobacter sp. I2-34]|uniref:Alpha/beta hydrolase n=1 Tax=Arthrobacter hankyongi TaxID=2904801 RepID=A0ABS9L773_9MICC|nr:alpha/beta hydrolase [Arthrobacter hankyongi]MCG2622526.1 alpha/beta hydrolase [Arthrobacter hankyongi]